MTELRPGLWARNPQALRPLADYRLIAFDMDSTLVRIETLDVLAQAAGCGAQVAAMTESAMQGEQRSYEDSLRQRVAMLQGVTQSAVDAVYEQHMALNPGVPQLIAACKAVGMRCILITGGFTCFAERLAARLGLDAVRANVLEMEGGVATGRLLHQPGTGLVDAAEKRATLLQACTELGIAPAQSIACGDGANDVLMLAAAGVGVAYHGKPIVRAQADVAIDAGGLDRLLEVLR